MHRRMSITLLISIIFFIFSTSAFAEETTAIKTHGDVQTAGECAEAQSDTPADVPHFISWIEFRANKLAESEKFYNKVFGWKTMPMEQNPNYRFFEASAGIMGGFISEIPEEAQGTVIYIYVPDIEEALKEIKSAGGEQFMDIMQIGEEGKIAFFSDPNGTMWALADMYYPPENTPYPFGEGGKPVANSLCFFEIYGRDLAKTGEFFTNVFGWSAPVNPDDPNHLVFNTGMGTQGVFVPETEGIPVLAYIWVDNVAATIEKVEAAGGTRYMDPFTPEHMGITFGYFVDPSGVVVGLLGEG